MKQLNSKWILIVLAFIISSCDNSENNKMIVGNWTGAEWLVEDGASNRNAQDTHFSFDDKGKYTYEYAGRKEEGTYKIENDMLFTKPTGELEIMVKIKKLTKDSLVFDMSRGGTPESLILLRK